MLFPRTKLIDAYIEKIEELNPHTVVIFGAKGSGKTTFLKLLENAGVLDPKKTEYVRTDIHAHETRISKPKYIVIDADISYNFSEIRTFIKSQLPETKIIYVASEIPEDCDEDVLTYEIPFIGFREFAEGHHHSVNITDVMQNTAPTERLIELRDAYIHLGAFGENLTKGENIGKAFEEKIALMKTDLFDKEEKEFMEFVRTIAMNVGELFKEERVAKIIGISRRKVRKYASILAKHRMVSAVGPFYEDSTVEVTRHVKLYFKDLSYIQSALGDGYYHGEMKQGVLENFIMLELERKLKKSHTIYFYRKKSGAQISFILEENETEKLTPIEVNLRDTGTISQALKTFDDSYHEKVDHYMVLNEKVAIHKDIGNLPVIILPHFAI